MSRTLVRSVGNVGSIGNVDSRRIFGSVPWIGVVWICQRLVYLFTYLEFRFSKIYEFADLEFFSLGIIGQLEVREQPVTLAPDDIFS